VYDSMGTNFDPSMGRAELYYKEKYENVWHMQVPGYRLSPQRKVL
jgi:hypothetical protein